MHVAFNAFDILLGGVMLPLEQLVFDLQLQGGGVVVAVAAVDHCGAGSPHLQFEH
jgi:hypothetical protein